MFSDVGPYGFVSFIKAISNKFQRWLKNSIPFDYTYI